MANLKNIASLKTLAKQIGFEATDEGIFLPYDSFENVEYGVAINGESENPRVYARVEEENRYGEEIGCFTPEFIIRTVSAGKRDYVVEEKEVGAKERNLGLMLAFISKSGIDPTFSERIYRGAVPLFPEEYRTPIISRKVNYALEGIKEIEELDHPEKKKIIGNLAKEIIACSVSGTHVEIEPELEGQMQPVYRELFIEGQIDSARKLKEFTGVGPENEVVQQGYKELLSVGLIDWAMSLKEFTGVGPENEVVQQGYKSLFSEGSIGSARGLKEFTGVGPEIQSMETEVQQGYKRLFSKCLIDSARGLKEFTGVRPEDTEIRKWLG